MVVRITSSSDIRAFCFKEQDGNIWLDVEEYTTRILKRYNGQYHCISGPAVTDIEGYEGYYLFGVKMSKEEHSRRVGLKIFW